MTLTQDQISRIKELRSKGYSIDGIRKETGHGKNTILKCIREDESASSNNQIANINVIFDRFCNGKEPTEVVREGLCDSDTAMSEYEKFLKMLKLGKERNILLKESREKGYNKGFEEGEAEGFNRGYSDGHDDGFRAAEYEYKVSFICRKCHQEAPIQPNSEEQENLIQWLDQQLRQQGWAHVKCPPKILLSEE